MDNKNFSVDVNFIEKQVGGNQDDSTQTFQNQKNIIENTENKYEQIVDYYEDMKRDNGSKESLRREDDETHTNVYRLNNFATTIDDIIISNPVIYPKEYDPYFEYIYNKNLNPINTRVVKTKNFINIDSSNRNTETTLNIGKYINLEDNSLVFKDLENVFRINLPAANKFFLPNDFMILRGFKNYTVSYKNLSFFFNRESSTVVINLIPNFDIVIPYYDIIIEISGVNYNGSNIYKNIPLSVINQIQKVFVFENYVGTGAQDIRIAFTMPIRFISDNESDKFLVSDCNITFYNLGNYPLNLINSNEPTTDRNLFPYLLVKEVYDNYLIVKLTQQISLNDKILLSGYWKDSAFYTGTNIQIAKIDSFIEGYKYPNAYMIPLDKNYNNICEIKMLSSEIPNPQLNIVTESSTFNYNKDDSTINVNKNSIQIINNKLYWNNILDSGIYSISLEPGYYTYPELKAQIESKAAAVPRQLIISDSTVDAYNYLTVQFEPYINKTSFNLYNVYSVPNCLYSISGSGGGPYRIRIQLVNSYFTTGDRIFITGSTDFYNISSSDINRESGHRIVRTLGNDFIEILLTNINTVANVGDTKGGYKIKIRTYAKFKMYFNFSDTMGDLLGFPYPGKEFSITPYCGQSNNFTITNKQSYYIDINQVYLANNSFNLNTYNTNYKSESYRYILLQAEGLNFNANPNGPPFFYKFLLNGPANSYIYNTFINTPIYFNPPLKSLKEFKFSFITPIGTPVNFNGLNHSFTLEITSINNFPENTNVNTFTSRI
jgi:hypothetical protein